MNRLKQFRELFVLRTYSLSKDRNLRVPVVNDNDYFQILNMLLLYICKHTQVLYFWWLFLKSQWEGFKICRRCPHSHDCVRVVNDNADTQFSKCFQIKFFVSVIKLVSFFLLIFKRNKIDQPRRGPDEVHKLKKKLSL